MTLDNHIIIMYRGFSGPCPLFLVRWFWLYSVIFLLTVLLVYKSAAAEGGGRGRRSVEKGRMAKGGLQGDGDAGGGSREKMQGCQEFGRFMCRLREQNPAKRRAGIAECLKEMHSRSEEGQVLVMSGLWNMAMTHPNDPEFLKLGVLDCMASLLRKALNDRKWLLRDQNLYIPYYAAHIIGSYTMNVQEFAEMAVEAGAVPPLVELLRGRLTWVEQRVAARALGHIASYRVTFPAVSSHEEVVESAMEVASGCLDTVYAEFLRRPARRRLRYHRDLLTRGAGGTATENRKAEEWASQLQCWSLHLLSCFAYRERFVPAICRRPGFLRNLPAMWGGLVNENSPAGAGLIRVLCYHAAGRAAVADSAEAVDFLCNAARSSDDWQHMAVQCLLLLLRDLHTRAKVIDKAAVALVDLAELQRLGDRAGVGDAVAEALLLQEAHHHHQPAYKFRARRALEELRGLRQRIRWEKGMCREDLRVKRAAALVVKLEGNSKFSAGDLRGAIAKYTEALALCPLKARGERLVLFSNRAQCHLLLHHPDSAISDTTRALCISDPVNSHGKSLWRRAQAYDMKGLAKESLLDAILFIKECSRQPDAAATSPRRYVKVPHYAAHMVKKQMQAAWLFADAARRHGGVSVSLCGIPNDEAEGYEEEEEEQEEEEPEVEDPEAGDESEWETVSEGNEEDTAKHIPNADAAPDRQQSSRPGGGARHGAALDSTPIQAQMNSGLPTIDEESLLDVDKSEKKKKKNYPSDRIECAAPISAKGSRTQRKNQPATCSA